MMEDEFLGKCNALIYIYYVIYYYIMYHRMPFYYSLNVHKNLSSKNKKSSKGKSGQIKIYFSVKTYCFCLTLLSRIYRFQWQ